MQTIYLGHTTTVNDIELKRNRIYTDRPTEIISKLKAAGLGLADKLFVPVDELNAAQDEFQNSASTISVALNQLKDFTKK